MGDKKGEGKGILNHEFLKGKEKDTVTKGEKIKPDIFPQVTSQFELIF